MQLKDTRTYPVMMSDLATALLENNQGLDGMQPCLVCLSPAVHPVSIGSLMVSSKRSLKDVITELLTSQETRDRCRWNAVCSACHQLLADYDTVTERARGLRITIQSIFDGAKQQLPGKLGEVQKNNSHCGPQSKGGDAVIEEGGSVHIEIVQSTATAKNAITPRNSSTSDNLQIPEVAAILPCGDTPQVALEEAGTGGMWSSAGTIVPTSIHTRGNSGENSSTATWVNSVACTDCSACNPSSDISSLGPKPLAPLNSFEDDRLYKEADTVKITELSDNEVTKTPAVREDDGDCLNEDTGSQEGNDFTSSNNVEFTKILPRSPCEYPEIDIMPETAGAVSTDVLETALVMACIPADASHTSDAQQKPAAEQVSVNSPKRSRTESRRYRCGVCGESFRNKSRLIWHRRRDHASVAGQYCCTLCGEKLRSRAALTRHTKRVHDGVGKPSQNICSVCQRVYQNAESLRAHMMLHDERALCCPYCDQKYTSRQDLEEHVARHTGARNCTCEHCGKTYRFRANLAHHVQTVHSNEQFSCPRCAKTFNMRKKLNRHYNIHHGQLRFTCSICERQFCYESQLHRHMRRSKHAPVSGGPLSEGSRTRGAYIEAVETGADGSQMLTLVIEGGSGAAGSVGTDGDADETLVLSMGDDDGKIDGAGVAPDSAIVEIVEEDDDGSGDVNAAQIVFQDS